MLQDAFAIYHAAGRPDPGSLAIPRSGEGKSSEREPGRPRVLVVDDEPRITDTLVEILNGSGFEASAAYDGHSALQAAARSHPDVLICDVLMPHMNGAELAIAIRQSYPATKILLFTGQAGVSEILQHAQQQGFVFDVVPKPIHPSRLIERLKEL